MAIEVDLSGTEEAIKLMQTRAMLATRRAAEAMGAVAERGIKQELSTSSHSKGTKTPSQPGEPPSLVTGQLRRSVRRTKSESPGDGVWEVTVAPTTVYARIQELGGRAGRNRTSKLPPRPYVKPAIARQHHVIAAKALEVFKRVISG